MMHPRSRSQQPSTVISRGMGRIAGAASASGTNDSLPTTPSSFALARATRRSLPPSTIAQVCPSKEPVLPAPRCRLRRMADSLPPLATDLPLIHQTKRDMVTYLLLLCQYADIDPPPLPPRKRPRMTKGDLRRMAAELGDPPYLRYSRSTHEEIDLLISQLNRADHQGFLLQKSQWEARAKAWMALQLSAGRALIDSADL